MANQLETLISKQKAEALANTNANVLAEQQGLESGLNTLTAEEAEVNPYYDTLIKDTNKAYQTNLGSVRSSAASRGAYWGSGGLSNQELKLGAENAERVSDYSAERTRKLADIARRRSLLSKQAQENIRAIQTKGRASIESTIAGLRYDAYKTEQANAQRMREIYASAAANRSSNAPTSSDVWGGALSDIEAFREAEAKGQITREAIATNLANKYKDYGITRDQLYKVILNTLPNKPTTSSVVKTSGGGSGIGKAYVSYANTYKKLLDQGNAKGLSLLKQMGLLR